MLAQAGERLPASSQVPGNLLAIAARIELDAGDAGRARELAGRALAAYDRAEAVEPGRREAMRTILDAASP